MSSDFRWNLPSTAIFAHHAPRFCNRQPCRCGPYRNSRPPRATATATSHSERTLCSDSIGLTVHPSASVPPHITRSVCSAANQPACLVANCQYRRRFMLLPLLGTSPVPSFPLGWPNVPLVPTEYLCWLRKSKLCLQCPRIAHFTH